MYYPFRCPSCDYEEELVMKMSEYTPDGHMCPKCGEEMKRTVESMACAMSIDNTGTFYRKIN